MVFRKSFNGKSMILIRISIETTTMVEIKTSRRQHHIYYATIIRVEHLAETECRLCTDKRLTYINISHTEIFRRKHWTEPKKKLKQL